MQSVDTMESPHQPFFFENAGGLDKNCRGSTGK